MFPKHLCVFSTYYVMDPLFKDHTSNFPIGR